jgi:hypothetical protein
MDVLTAFHHVVWMGDLNYRYGTAWQRDSTARHGGWAWDTKKGR